LGHQRIAASQLHQGGAIGQAERFPTCAEIIPTAINHTGARYAINRRPAGLGQGDDTQVVAEIIYQGILGHMKVLRQALTNDGIFLHLRNKIFDRISAVNQEGIGPGALGRGRLGLGARAGFGGGRQR
jgi:hypothetical protein